MSNILVNLQENILNVALNKVTKHNAFDEELIAELQIILEKADKNPEVKVIVLSGNGKNFSSGADLGWMQRMANFSEIENKNDALALAKLMHTLYALSKPTIAMIQGATYGGGLGLIAACDIAIASTDAKFCFSETKLGLIPAVISPYIIQSIGKKAATWLFISAEIFDAKKALDLQLIQYTVEYEKLSEFTKNFAKKISLLPTQAVCDAKALVKRVAYEHIDDKLIDLTATLIAKKRVSKEAQTAIQIFLTKDVN